MGTPSSVQEITEDELGTQKQYMTEKAKAAVVRKKEEDEQDAAAKKELIQKKLAELKERTPPGRLMDRDVPDHKINRETVDEDGDAILRHSKTKEFLVSTKLLSLVSPCFKATFKACAAEARAFREASELRADGMITLPIIDCFDDDEKSLSVMLHTVHFSKKYETFKPGLDTQLAIAQVSAKYDCIVAMQRKSSVWLESIVAEKQTTANQFKILATSYLLCHPAKFINTAHTLAQSLTQHDLQTVHSLDCLPDDLYGTSLLR